MKFKSFYINNKQGFEQICIVSFNKIIKLALRNLLSLAVFLLAVVSFATHITPSKIVSYYSDPLG